MFYNTGNLDDAATENSILDTTVAEKYLARLSKYPLPLDVALPIFRWGIVFRDGQFFKLINGLDSARLVDQNLFYGKTANRFAVKKATFLEGHFLHEGDEIRLETAAPAALEWAARQIRGIGDLKKTVAFFALDSSSARAFPPLFLEKIIRTAR